VTVFMIAEGGQAKDFIAKWSADLFAAEARLKEYMTEIGATEAYRLPFEKPRGFGFPGAVPEGWTQPINGRNYSQPKRLNDGGIGAKLDALEWPIDLEDLANHYLGLPSSFKYDANGDGLYRHVGLQTARIQRYSMSWISPTKTTEGAYILGCPDYEACIKGIGVDITWMPEGTNPETGNGLRRISEEDLEALIDLSDAARGREEMEAAEAAYSLAQAADRDVEAPSPTGMDI
jgi:hypothetical protein